MCIRDSCRKNGDSISRCFKRQTRTYRDINEQSKQKYRQQQSTQKLFKDFFRNSQDLPNQKAPNSYVSPQRTYKPFNNNNKDYHNRRSRDHTKSPYRQNSNYNRPRSQSWNRNENYNKASQYSRSPIRYPPHSPSKTPNQSRQNSPHYRHNSPNPKDVSNISDQHINLLADDTQTALQLAANENSLTDEQFLQFVNYFDVGIIETAHSLNKSNNANSW